MNRPASRPAMQKRCDQFNAAFPAGTRILVHPVMREPETQIRTVAAAGARILGGHSPVVHVTDGGGCWHLDNVAGRAP